MPKPHITRWAQSFVLIALLKRQYRAKSDVMASIASAMLAFPSWFPRQSIRPKPLGNNTNSPGQLSCWPSTTLQLLNFSTL
jgi:hypothetical protein